MSGKNSLAAIVAGLIVAVIAIGVGFGRSVPASHSGTGVSASSPPQSAGRLPQASSPGSGVPAADTPARTFSLRLDQAQVAAMTERQWTAIARHNDIVVLNSWDYRLIPVLRRANPKVRVWVYKDLSGIRSDDCTTADGQCGGCAGGVMDSRFLSSGMGYCWVLRHHRDWLLRSTADDRPFQFRGYRGIWETDYGDPGYQRLWIANVLADVRAHGWDGVDVDNALTTADAYGVAAKYPSSEAVQAATYSALLVLGPAFSKAGVDSVVNVGYATRFPALWKRWAAPVGGLEQEFYLSGSTHGAVGSGWQAYEDELSACVSQRKSCWFHASGYAPSAASQASDYALASYLIGTDGRQFLSVGNAISGRPTCPTIGRPLSKGQQLGSAWRRTFAGGVVVVNPTMSILAVDLGPGYFDHAGHSVSSVTLKPASGAILGSARRACT